MRNIPFFWSMHCQTFLFHQLEHPYSFFPPPSPPFSPRKLRIPIGWSIPPIIKSGTQLPLPSYSQAGFCASLSGPSPVDLYVDTACLQDLRGPIVLLNGADFGHGGGIPCDPFRHSPAGQPRVPQGPRSLCGLKDRLLLH